MAGLSGFLSLANSGVPVFKSEKSIDDLSILEFSTPQDTYWAGGMRIAWDMALERIEPCDWVLWLNDDTLLDPNALQVLLETMLTNPTRAVAVGACRAISGMVSYGGLLSTSRLAPMNLRQLAHSVEVQICDTFNGNLVLIDYQNFKELGGFPTGYTHLRADIDFGFVAKKRGLSALVAPGTLATCEPNEGYEDYKDLKGLSLLDRIMKVNGPKFGPYSEHFRLCIRHGGRFGVVFALAPIYRIFKAK